MSATVHHGHFSPCMPFVAGRFLATYLDPDVVPWDIIMDWVYSIFQDI